MKTLFSLLLVLASTMPAQEPSVTRTLFGTMPDGKAVHQFTLRNAAGMEVSFMEFGATMISVKVPSQSGEVDEVTVNKATLDEYLAGHPLLGSTVGRYANRIDCRETGGLVIDGKTHKLKSVNAKNGVHIHGGPTGFQKQLWKGGLVPGDPTSFTLRHTSPDGHEGFPGTLDVTITVALSEDNALSLVYEATTDKPTHLALTNHVYWNLAGEPEKGVLDHEVQIAADEMLEFDDRLVPTGKYLPVAGTGFDFRSAAFKIGARAEDVPKYDHHYRIAGFEKGAIRPCAHVVDPKSGRSLTIVTTEPGVQFYTGNRAGFCLETQHFPNSPNIEKFPSTLLRPGETFSSQTVYRFGW